MTYDITTKVVEKYRKYEQDIILDIRQELAWN